MLALVGLLFPGIARSVNWFVLVARACRPVLLAGRCRACRVVGCPPAVSAPVGVCVVGCRACRSVVSLLVQWICLGWLFAHAGLLSACCVSVPASVNCSLSLLFLSSLALAVLFSQCIDLLLLVQSTDLSLLIQWVDSFLFVFHVGAVWAPLQPVS